MLQNPAAFQIKWPISALLGLIDLGCMLAVTSSACPGPHRSNTGMINVRCLSLHTPCLSALELLAKSNSSSNLSLYVWEGRNRGQWNENDQTLLNCCIYMWLETGCLSECLSVYLSISLASVLAPCFMSVGRDLLVAVSH